MPRISLSIFWKYKKNIRRDFISPWGRSAFCKLKIGSYYKKSVSHLLNRRLCQTVSQISSALGETHDSPGLFQFLTDFLKAGASVPWPMAKGCDCESFIGLASFPLKICFPILFLFVLFSLSTIILYHVFSKCQHLKLIKLMQILIKNCLVDPIHNDLT